MLGYLPIKPCFWSNVWFAILEWKEDNPLSVHQYSVHDLQVQTPKILFITAADTEILGLAQAWRRMGESNLAIQATHLRDLTDRGQLDRYVREVLPGSQVLLVRMLGGRAYFADGFEILHGACKKLGISFIPLPGTRDLDPDLNRLSTESISMLVAVQEYFVQGGVENYENLIRFLFHQFVKTDFGFLPPKPTPERGLYEPPDLLPVPGDARWSGSCFTGPIGFPEIFNPSINWLRNFIGKGAGPDPFFAKPLKKPMRKEFHYRSVNF